MSDLTEPEFVKKLSPNDVGETNSHQAGLLIPRRIALTNYFPKLDFSTQNPREVLEFEIWSNKTKLELNFIYYNSKYHGTGTRLEYRLTGMTKFLREQQLKAGDEIEFFVSTLGIRTIKVVKAQDVSQNEIRNQAYISRNGWKIRERH